MNNKIDGEDTDANLKKRYESLRKQATEWKEQAYFWQTRAVNLEESIAHNSRKLSK